ncbi:MAG: hypothetical protein IJ298_06385 [Ruminococcus sp.]|nr:hypothetical protein [Ruminococcus sp.]
MTDKAIAGFHRIYKILLSASIIAAGLCLIYGCLTIYYSGDQPYSRQAVADAFSLIAVPVYICLGLILVSLVINLIFPDSCKKAKQTISAKSRLTLLLSKKNLDACNSEMLASVNKQKKSRRLFTIIQAVVVAVSGAVFLVYALNGSNYDNSQINSSMINAMQVLLPCLCVMLAASVIAHILRNKSYKQECELISKLPSVKIDSSQPLPTADKADRKLLILRCVILLAGAGILIYGFLAGGAADVLTKAVNICTECIGLG